MLNPREELGEELGRTRDSHLLRSDVKARQGELTADSLQLTASVGYGIRNTPERLAVSRKPIADPVETMMTADGLRLTARMRMRCES
jgi:hypothetical protein